jgi:hypothetical protein
LVRCLSNIIGAEQLLCAVPGSCVVIASGVNNGAACADGASCDISCATGYTKAGAPRLCTTGSLAGAAQTCTRESCRSACLPSMKSAWLLAASLLFTTLPTVLNRTV